MDNSETATEISKLREEIEKLTGRLEATLSDGDNPISAKCEMVLETPAKCYDFSGTRRYASCRAWDLMEKEHIGWQEAITKAWSEVRTVCTWD